MTGPSANSNPPPEGRHIGQIFFRRVAELCDRTFIKLQKEGRFEEVSWRNRDRSSLTDFEIEAALWTQIAGVNARLEHYEQIRKISLMKNDFPPEVRSVNVFQKIKVDRKVATERYRREIDEIYSLPASGDLD
jgi:long-subunit acyl-CoA synthetase (AMP-forming)